jgi:DNA-binding CsgD family transcriptional regulator
MQRNSRKPLTPPTAEADNSKYRLPINLTDREQQVLMWVAQGKSSWEIGHIIHCEECTVNFHCRNIMGKLNVSTRAHAAIKAFGLGLLSP